jgi:hypothetical protein
MNVIEEHMDDWYLQCIPDDGGRISVLRYSGQDLITTGPPAFKAPGKFLGEYETRPVFGYDDCFPTVDPCSYPGQSGTLRDHGELCWEKWQVRPLGNRLICTVDCPNPDVAFSRILEFSGNTLQWKFEVTSRSVTGLPFLHVMHALMPLKNLQSLDLPLFDRILDESTSAELDLNKPRELNGFLMNTEPGRFRMLLMKNPEQGFVRLGLKERFMIEIGYPVELFPTLGIWWNNLGYPDEEGIRRAEYAFEPIPGSCSDLSRSFADGSYLLAEPGKPVNWEINWVIKMER